MGQVDQFTERFYAVHHILSTCVGQSVLRMEDAVLSKINWTKSTHRQTHKRKNKKWQK